MRCRLPATHSHTHFFLGVDSTYFFDEQVRVVELGSDSAKFFNGASPWGGHRNQ